MHLIVEKGSVTVDGISLTAFNLTDDTFTVAVIPHTQQVTTLGVRKVGDKVNIEMDMLAKHIERMNPPSAKATRTKNGGDDERSNKLKKFERVAQEHRRH